MSETQNQSSLTRPRPTSRQPGEERLPVGQKQPVADPTHLTALITLNVAEYQAIMSRGTALMTNQVQAAALAFVAIALLLNSHILDVKSSQSFLWYGLLILQLIALCQAQGMLEHYTTIHYLETELRPKVESLVKQTGAFWQYESYLAARRGGTLLFLEFTIACAAAACLALIFAARFTYLLKWVPALADSVGLALNVVALLYLVVLNRRSIRIRRSWSLSQKHKFCRWRKMC